MAINCKICGGQIKIQANMAGICQGCGIEYDIEAIRAMTGNPSSRTISEPAPVSGEVSVKREVIVEHLADLRVLETLCSKNRNVLSAIDRYLSNEDSLRMLIKEKRDSVSHSALLSHNMLKKSVNR